MPQPAGRTAHAHAEQKVPLTNPHIIERELHYGGTVQGKHKAAASSHAEAGCMQQRQNASGARRAAAGALEEAGISSANLWMAPVEETGGRPPAEREAPAVPADTVAISLTGPCRAAQDSKACCDLPGVSCRTLRTPTCPDAAAVLQ